MNMNQDSASVGYEQAYMPVQKPPQLTNPMPIAIAVIVGMLTITLAVIGLIAVGWVDISLLREANLQGGLEYFDVEAYELRNALVGVLHLGSFMLTVILFAIWVYTVTKNARELTGDTSRLSPGWAVGWYFIPIANLFKPYQVMRDTWHASIEPASWENQAAPKLINIWWTLWIMLNIASNALNQLAVQNAIEIEAVVAYSLLLNVAELALIAVASTLVWKLSKLQTQWLPGHEQVVGHHANPYNHHG
jgi:hypothetical protein